MVKKCFLVICDSDLHAGEMEEIPSTYVIGGTWREAAKDIRERGWMISNDGRHYCPECCRAENAEEDFLKGVRGKRKASIKKNESLQFIIGARDTGKEYFLAKLREKKGNGENS